MLKKSADHNKSMKITQQAALNTMFKMILVIFQMDGMKQQPNSSEGMLANFFNSLLHKKTGVATLPRAGTPYCLSPFGKVRVTT